jgi:hypothetical protein
MATVEGVEVALGAEAVVVTAEAPLTARAALGDGVRRGLEQPR